VEPLRHHRPPVRLAIESRAGIGTALLEALDRRARASGARCLWLETQNINYPAIQFYRRSGFRLCGLDDTLYDPERDPTTGPDEVALFFTRPL
jgi:ribosomal protein S18 acetylase RimI-like enzyme